MSCNVYAGNLAEYFTPPQPVAKATRKDVLDCLSVSRKRIQRCIRCASGVLRTKGVPRYVAAHARGCWLEHERLLRVLDALERHTIDVRHGDEIEHQHD